jgi:hypothetical protein
MPTSTYDHDDARSRPASSMLDAAVVSGLVRASLGACGFVGALLFMPVHFATPILSGISMLMMITGCTSLMRAARYDKRVNALLKGMAAVCALVLVATLGMVLVMGAGRFAPEPTLAPASAKDDGTVRFAPR